MKENIFIKAYFYLNSGVSILNNFRNLFLGIFALYFTLKLTSPALLLLMFLVAVPALIVVGYYNVHKILSVSERLNIKHGTHYQIKQFELIEKQTQLLEEIKNHLSTCSQHHP